MAHLIIGTAGHIDHGKTSVVKALTGVDTDRLKEEKERGLTIDLGFAHLSNKATIIDVPGHEKFIRNMVAGVSTIDFVLFIVAADDGVMPQTREHLDILKILQVKHGIIVITKIDIVEEDWLHLVIEDVRGLVQGSFLENVPIVTVSTVINQGISELASIMDEECARITQKQNKGIFWMPTDRSFTMKGFGTVVTGSILSGETKVGESLELLPQKKIVKIRGLQSRGGSVEKVIVGDRAAINLQALAKSEIQRGDVLATPDYFKPSVRFDARLQLLESAPKSIKPRTRVRLHFGTTEVMARISLLQVAKIDPGESAFVQFHLEKPAAARRMDAFVIRQYSPTITIGGGIILDANARRHKLSDPTVLQKIKALEKEDPLDVLVEKLITAEFSLLTQEQLISEIAIAKESLQGYLDELEKDQKLIPLKIEGKKAVIYSNNFEKLQKYTQDILENFHKQNPTKLGISKTEIHKYFKPKIKKVLLDYCLEDLKKNSVINEAAGLISLKEHKLELSPQQQNLREKIERLLFEEGFATSSEKEMTQKLSTTPEQLHDLLTLMINLEEVVRVEGNIYFHPERISEAKEKVVSFLNKNKEITVSQFKDLLQGTSRKYAMPVLKYFDGIGVTERIGDVRISGNR